MTTLSLSKQLTWAKRLTFGVLGVHASSAIQGSMYNFVANTATVNGVAQPNSISSLADTRSTIGYDLAASTQFAINAARRTSAGLLIEPSETNSIVQSQAFNNASWPKASTTVVDNSTTAPDGTTTAALITATGTTSTEVKSTAVSLSSGVAYVASAYIKLGSIGTWINFSVGDDATVQCGAYFDIQNLVVGTIANTGGTTSATSITAVGNGWVRVVIVFSFTTNKSPFIQFRMTTANNGLFNNISGQNCYIWGAQLNSNTLNTYSYFPTTSAAATMGADAAVLTTASNAAIATVTFSDASTQTLAVPVNNQLPLSSAILNKTLLSSINIPAPVTSYTGVISTTSISYNPTVPTPYASCKYTCAPFSVASSSWKITIPSWYVEYTGGTYVETNIGASFTVKASVESPPGTFTPIAFSGVTTGSTVTPGTDLQSDAITVSIAAGATPNLWFFFVTDGTHGIPQALFGANGTTSVCQSSASPNDQTATGGTVTSNMGGFTPLVITGTTSKPTVMVMGDSRTRFPSGGAGGEVPRQLDLANISYIDTGAPGERGSNYAASHTKRAALNVNASHITNGYGINDFILNGVSDATLRGTITAIMSLFPGKPQILTTLPPSTTSTDSWATPVSPFTGTSNQTTSIPSGALETHNTWRMTVPTPAVATWDICSAVAVLVGGFWVWKGPGYTADGLHETATGISAIGSSGVVATANLRL